MIHFLKRPDTPLKCKNGSIKSGGGRKRRPVQKILSAALSIAVFATVFAGLPLKAFALSPGANILNSGESNFDYYWGDGHAVESWGIAYGGSGLTVSSDYHYGSGDCSMKMTGRTQSYYSPQINIFNKLKTGSSGGAGRYSISLYLRTEASTYGRIILRCNRNFSFTTENDTSGPGWRHAAGNFISVPGNTWTLLTFSFSVSDDDLRQPTGSIISVMLDTIYSSTIYVDSVNIFKSAYINLQMPAHNTMYAGNSFDLFPADGSYYPDYGTVTLTKTSSNDSVASIVNNQIQAHQPGTAVITVSGILSTVSGPVSMGTRSFTLTVTEGAVYRISSGSPYNNALAALSIDDVAHYGPNPGSANQMWYISYSGGYYKLENLGYREPTTVGAAPYVLTADSSSDLSLKKDTNATNQQWILTASSGGMRTIACRAYPDLLLTVGTQFGSTYLSTNDGSSQWKVSNWNVGEVALSNYWGGGYAGVSGAKHINVIVDSTALGSYFTMNNTYNYGTYWNGIDPNINISVFRYDAAYIPPADFTVNVVGANANGDFLAMTMPDNNPNADVNAEWSSVTIYMNTNSSPYNPNTLNRSGIPDENKQMTFIHELGHALKLAHPVHSGYPSQESVLAIMNQGAAVDYTFTNFQTMSTETISHNPMIPIVPSGHDKANLIRKWW